MVPVGWVRKREAKLKLYYYYHADRHEFRCASLSWEMTLLKHAWAMIGPAVCVRRAGPELDLC